MNKDLITTDSFNGILTKAGDINALTFRTIDDKALVEIESWMPEVNRAVSCFSKQNSQTTSSLMSLNMIDSGPYRVLRQILAQAEKKRSALNEAVYKLELKKIKFKELEIAMTDAEGLSYEKLSLKRNKIQCDAVDSQTHIEASIKELGALKRRYEEVCTNNDIPEQWDEADFEDAEIEHHIKSIFRNGVRDRLQGSHNMGTMEYMEQFGVNPITAYALIDKYINDTRNLIIEEDKGADITAHYNFYDNMYKLFKNEYKKAAARLGLDNITHADFLMKENK
jgi:BMFP domain-containing protein YqiC